MQSISFDTAIIHVGTASICSAALVFRQPSLVFFLPLAFSSNLVLLMNISKAINISSARSLEGTVLSDWVSLMDLEIKVNWPIVTIQIGIVVTFVVAVSGFILRRTPLIFRTKTTRQGIVFSAIQNGALSGVFVAMQFGLPVLISCLATWFTSSPVPIGNIVLAAAFYPFVVCTTLGATIGGILGFVSVFATCWRRWLALALVSITGAILALELYIGSFEANLSRWIVSAPALAIIIVLLSISEWWHTPKHKPNGS